MGFFPKTERIPTDFETSFPRELFLLLQQKNTVVGLVKALRECACYFEKGHDLYLCERGRSEALLQEFSENNFLDSLQNSWEDTSVGIFKSLSSLSGKLLTKINTYSKFQLKIILYHCYICSRELKMLSSNDHSSVWSSTLL